MSNFLTEEMLFKKSPQEITSLLYEACLNNLETALVAVKEKDYSLANQKLIKAYDIIHRLDAGINYEAGIIADQLDAVYEYIGEKIIEANLKKSVLAIEEAIKLLTRISDAWNDALNKSIETKQKPTNNKAVAYDKFSAYDN